MSHLDLLQPYPFERLRALFKGLEHRGGLPHINLSIGEPKHPTPEIINRAVCDNLSGLSAYPATLGIVELRAAISNWILRRFQARVDIETQVLPILGSREALFAFAQVALDSSPSGSLVAFPNPFYQIYEGASLLGGASPRYLNISAITGMPDLDSLNASEWDRVKLLYVCSPNNPTGAVYSLDDWKTLFEMADRHGFVLASDECYSEIYLDEKQPPLGALQAATILGRKDFKNLVVFSSLSKRSNAPGLRSGYVAGDAIWIAKFLKYRTYHGSAMSNMVQYASIAAWNDEQHVLDNRDQYREKFQQFKEILGHKLTLNVPPAGFYYWVNVSGSDTEFAKKLFEETHITVLPGSFLGRTSGDINPGANHIRIALVASAQECAEAAKRIATLL